MTRTAKLYQKMLDHRRLSFAEFCQLLESFCYARVRTKGSHQAYRHAGIHDTRIIQPRGKDAKPYQVEQFLDIIEAHGLKLGD